MLMEGQMGHQNLQGENWVEENNNKAAKKGQGGRKGRGRMELHCEEGVRMQGQGEAAMLSLLLKVLGAWSHGPMARLKLAAAPAGFPCVSGCSLLLPTISRVSLASSMLSLCCAGTDCSSQPQTHHESFYM